MITTRYPAVGIDGSRTAYCQLKTWWRLVVRERNPMKSKALAVQSTLEMAENRPTRAKFLGTTPFRTHDTTLFGFVVLLIVVAG